ncbi:MAG: hypothetical protein M0P99_03385 [Candidatus Cloacimonetes bacterium]|nr:hypothetical protein [Candidatus Cloacimonadota bacterium]
MYNLLFVSSRWGEYASILRDAKDSGYSFLRLDEFVELVRNNQEIPKPFLILRHDIDTDSPSALRFCEIERELSVKATYFFRKRTWNVSVIKKVLASGHEIGYHFEELATYAKRHHLKSAKELQQHLIPMMNILEANLVNLPGNITINSLASHGDFANRKLNTTNSLIVQSPAFREKLGIVYEAYDKDITTAYQNHVSDRPYPLRFFPRHPSALIKKLESFLFLTHPRWWQRNAISNIIELVNRVKEHMLW